MLCVFLKTYTERLNYNHILTPKCWEAYDTEIHHNILFCDNFRKGIVTRDRLQVLLGPDQAILIYVRPPITTVW